VSITNAVEQNQNEESVSSSSSPYAYAWVLGGVNEFNSAYKGFISDILISARLLQKAGSIADFWLYVRLSPNSKLETMPEEDLRLLDALGIKVKHLQKLDFESFSNTMYDKFHVLNMTGYKRVIFLDADTIPLPNLDYYFHLSDTDYKELPTLLKPFFIHASRKEPTNGGMFMVEPSTWIYENI